MSLMNILFINHIHPLENNSSLVTVLDVGERGSSLIDNTCYYLPPYLQVQNQAVFQ